MSNLTKLSHQATVSGDTDVAYADNAVNTSKVNYNTFLPLINSHMPKPVPATDKLEK
jgi:hypothetical protein